MTVHSNSCVSFHTLNWTITMYYNCRISLRFPSIMDIYKIISPLQDKAATYEMGLRYFCRTNQLCEHIEMNSSCFENGIFLAPFRWLTTDHNITSFGAVVGGRWNSKFSYTILHLHFFRLIIESYPEPNRLC